MFTDIHGHELKAGQAVRVFCVIPETPLSPSRASKSLGTIVEHENNDGLAVLYQGELMRIDAFKLEVIA